MAKFCRRCGQPLVEGQECSCCAQPQVAQPVQAPVASQPVQQQFTVCNRCGKQIPVGTRCSCVVESLAGKINVPKVEKGAIGRLIEKIMNHMGIGDPELNKGDAFEKGNQIVPDSVRPSEGEIPVKQYEVAKLRTRICGIPFARAVGRMQVTNKRVIFRAPGRCFAGRTTLQHEFAIDEVAGVEARREYVFSPMDFVIGCGAVVLGGLITSLLIGLIGGKSMAEGKFFLTLLLTYVVAAGGCFPFITMKKKWLLKLLCLGTALVPMFTYGSAAAMMGKMKEEFLLRLFGGILNISAWIVLLFVVFCLFIYTIRPNLILKVKTKVATNSVDIKRSRLKISFLGGAVDNSTGFMEVMPADDVEGCIREIDAMIVDLQKNGNCAIEKWKV